jgi:DNA-binding transcriptional MerR regulator
MNNIKNSFSIKDLENLSGIKAHTIRIWEKRYNLLEPERTDTNIRTYSLENLQKLLNVSYLNKNGYKISKIATLKKEEIPNIINEIAKKIDIENPAIKDFKVAMLNYDQVKFYNIYRNLSKDKSFKEIFYEVFIPLLSEIGMLWQTDIITPAHEHFITTLIRQKILVNTELIQEHIKPVPNKTFVLYLPNNEIHELGLMFINYELISKGYQSIFLGQSIPIDNLKELINYNNEVIFISYFTIKPEKEDLLTYLEEFHEKILNNSNTKFWILGRMIEHLDPKKLSNKITTFKSIDDLVKIL